MYVPISKYEILHGTFLRPDFTKSPWLLNSSCDKEYFMVKKIGTAFKMI